jgi:hypothetical protein
MTTTPCWWRPLLGPNLNPNAQPPNPLTDNSYVTTPYYLPNVMSLKRITIHIVAQSVLVCSISSNSNVFHTVVLFVLVCNIPSKISVFHFRNIVVQSVLCIISSKSKVYHIVVQPVLVCSIPSKSNVFHFLNP